MYFDFANKCIKQQQTAQCDLHVLIFILLKHALEHKSCNFFITFHIFGDVVGVFCKYEIFLYWHTKCV